MAGTFSVLRSQRTSPPQGEFPSAFLQGLLPNTFFFNALICFLQESYTIWYFVPECKFLMTGTTSVLFSGNYPLGLLLVKKFPFEHEVGWLTAFQFSCSECLQP